MWHRVLAGALGCALVLSFFVSSMASRPVEAQARDDYALPNGWFYSQTNGKGGGGDIGYSVTNAGGVPFYDWFNRFGGVTQVGYPVSHRFIWKGFTVQAFQKVVFQWRPEVEQVYFVNVFDEISDAGLDDRAFEQRAIPRPANWGNDAGLNWNDVVDRHLSILAQNPAIESAYYDSPDPVLFNGLPMGTHDFGNVFVVRAQRKVFQQWKVDVPWARPGEVVVANGGDIGKEFGLYPEAAVRPGGPGDGQVPVPEQQPVATATVTATAAPNQCRGDERLTFNPPSVVAGQQLFIIVTSDRASANVALVGPYNPQLVGVAQNGPLTVWTWTVTPPEAGQLSYSFTVENNVCATSLVPIGPAPAPPAGATPVPTAAATTPSPTIAASPTAQP